MSVFHPSKPNPRKPAPAKLEAPALKRSRAMSFAVDRLRESRATTDQTKQEPKS
ncbi:hypothetical protein GCM10007242_44530 [Pigmentiphaga litoralis]|nr:hypothetical protein GCM10007242_44530 [Pigmentiphaga litoralis]